MSRKRNKTISIPNELFDAIEGYRDVNWSEVAAEAYRRHVDLLKRKEFPMSAIDRLRKSKAEATSEAYEAGKLAGARWATESAEWTELRNLSRFKQEIERNYQVDYFTDDDEEGSAYSSSQDLFYRLDPRRDGDVSASQEFWERWLVDDIDGIDSDLLRGFLDGAVDVFDDVKDQL